MKVLIRIIIVLVVFAILGSFEFVIVANDFAMLSIINQNKESMTKTIEDASSIYSDQSFYDLSFEFLSESNEEGNTDYDKLNVTFKYNKISDTESEFISSTKIESSELGVITTTEYDLYYTEGVLYKKEGADKTKQTLNSNDALAEIGFGLTILYLAPFTIDIGTDDTLVSSLCYSMSPFYIGQTYTMTDDSPDIDTIIFKVDILGNLREYAIDSTASTNDINTKTIFNGTKAPTLTFPTDLTTYI